jgi:hypothetical protein
MVATVHDYGSREEAIEAVGLRGDAVARDGTVKPSDRANGRLVQIPSNCPDQPKPPPSG